MSSSIVAPCIELHPSLADALGEEEAIRLKAMFFAYKTGRRPEAFGRDVPFDWPAHVALSLSGEIEPNKWFIISITPGPPSFSYFFPGDTPSTWQ